MPTDYAPRDKPMHAREVRYEREKPFSGKRDWHRVAVFERSPGVSSVNGCYGPASKRRPSGRHGFSGENGRYSREHTRMSEHQSMYGTGYSGFGHKNDRYVVAGGIGNYSTSTAGKNGFKDADEDHFRERVLSSSVERLLSPSNHSAQPLHTYHSFVEASSHSDGQKGSRWDSLHRLDREHRERPSSSPDVSDRKPGVSKLGWSLQDKEIEGRLDRYGVGRETVFGDSKSKELPDGIHEFSDPFKATCRLQESQRGGIIPGPDISLSPKKRPRLGWGQGLAKYEQAKVEVTDTTSRVRPSDDEVVPPNIDEKDSCADTVPHSESDDAACVPFSDKDLTPTREPTPTADPVTEPTITEPTITDDAHQLPLLEVDDTIVKSPSLPCSSTLLHDSPQDDSVEEDVLVRDCNDVPDQPDSNSAKLGEPEAPADKEPAEVKANLSHDGLNGLNGVSKEVVLGQVEKVEFEIDSIEKELARLVVVADEVLLKSFDTKVDSDEQKFHVSSDSGEAECLKEELELPASDDMVVDAQEPNASCLQDQLFGRMSFSDENLEDFAHLLPKGFVNDGRKLYSCPQETSAWSRNEELYEINKYKILEQLRKRRQGSKFKEQSLVLKYRLLKEMSEYEYSGGVSKKERPRGTRRTDSECRNGLGQWRIRQADGYLAMEDPGIMKRLLLEPLTRFRESSRMPSMILDEKEKSLQHIITNNRLVEEPITFEQERKSINPWTSEEKKIFLEKFALFYKNFGKIASFLQHKTVGDCVEFYYRNQKSEEFEKLRKKQQLKPKKRHSRASYLATTTPTSSRFRESNAVSLPRMHTASAVASAASSVGKDNGKPSRSTTIRIVDRERLNECVTVDAVGKSTARKEVKAGNVSGGVSSIVTGLCSLSSDAPLTPSRVPCEKIFLKEEHCAKQKGVRSSYSRREQAKAVGEEVESEWTDNERELFVNAVLLFGKDFRSIALHVRSKTEGQCKTFFSKARKRLKLDRIVEQHHLAQATARMQDASPGSVAVDYDEAVRDRRVTGVESCRTAENEDMDVSVVVDSVLKEGNDVADADDIMEGTSAAPAALVDSPVSSVITSPGLMSTSSPAIQASITRTSFTNDPVDSSAAVLELKQFAEPELDKGREKDFGELLQKQGKDWSVLTISSKALTEVRTCLQNSKSKLPLEGNGMAATKKSCKRRADDIESSEQGSHEDSGPKKNAAASASALLGGVPGQSVRSVNNGLMVPTGLFSALYPGIQLQSNAFQKQQSTGQQPFCLPTAQAPPVVLNEQQQMLILQHQKQMAGHNQHQKQDEELYKQLLLLQQHQLLQQGLRQQPHTYLPHLHFQQTAQQVVKQEKHLTNNPKAPNQHQVASQQQPLLAFQQQYLQQDQPSQVFHQHHQIVHQQQQLLHSLLTQQQLALQTQQSGNFPHQKQIPVSAGVQLLEPTAEQAGHAAKFIQDAFLPTDFANWQAAQAKATSSEEQQSRGSDIKLFGQSLLSQPTTAKLSSDQSYGTSSSSLTKSVPSESTKTVPFLLAEGWGSGSADRDFSARCAVNNGILHAVSRGLPSGSLPDAAKLQSGEGALDWHLHARAGGNACTRQALNLWKAAADNAAGELLQSAAPIAYSQQQGGLKDGMLFGSSHLMQFPTNGNGWSSVGNPVHAQQARILAQLSSAAPEQQQQQQQHGTREAGSGSSTV